MLKISSSKWNGRRTSANVTIRIRTERLIRLWVCLFQDKHNVSPRQEFDNVCLSNKTCSCTLLGICFRNLSFFLLLFLCWRRNHKTLITFSIGTFNILPVSVFTASVTKLKRIYDLMWIILLFACWREECLRPAEGTSQLVLL